jgi:hypothetical protein
VSYLNLMMRATKLGVGQRFSNVFEAFFTLGRCP